MRLGRVYGNPETNARAFVWLGIDFAGAADVGQAFAHVLEAVFGRGVLGRCLGSEAAAVVFDGEREGVLLEC